MLKNLFKKTQKEEVQISDGAGSFDTTLEKTKSVKVKAPTNKVTTKKKAEPKPEISVEKKFDINTLTGRERKMYERTGIKPK